MAEPTVTITTRPDHPGDGARLAKLLAKVLISADRRRRERTEDIKETRPWPPK